jgi:hypothetical protein
MEATLVQLRIGVRDVAPLDHAAAPTLRFALEVEADRPVRSLLLDTTVRIAVRRRAYDPAEQERLFAVFGATAGWGTALQSLLWTRQTTVVPPFDARADVDLLVPCSYDLEVAAAAYLAALGDGAVPLELQFAGSVFRVGDDGALQVERLSWELEAGWELPVAAWRAAIDRHFPGAGWLRLRRATLDRLAAYRARTALSWDEAIDALLEGRP